MPTDGRRYEVWQHRLLDEQTVQVKIRKKRGQRYIIVTVTESIDIPQKKQHNIDGN